MKLLELEIWNVRGIPYLLLKPDGANFVIWGSNGSGKSAVVDAVDFLLTGQVTRLTGKGTGGITLEKHGPHIDHKTEDAVVRAKILLAGSKDVAQIERCMADPNTLICDSKVRPRLQPIIALAKKGQHVLTRREILKYVTAEGSTRAQEIQDLLNLSDIEEIRKAFVRVANDHDRSLESARIAVQKAKAAINATVQQKTFSVDFVLQIVNQNRAVLRGNPIAELSSETLKKQVTAPAIARREGAVNVALFERDISNLRNVMLPENQDRLGRADKQLRDLVTLVTSNPELMVALSRVQLTQLGIKLANQKGTCPLCDTPWPPGKLIEYLQQRLSTAQVAAGHQNQILRLSSVIVGDANKAVASIEQVVSVAKMAGLSQEVTPLSIWLAKLAQFSTMLSTPLEKYPDPSFNSDSVRQLLATNDLEQCLEKLATAIKAKYPETTPEQNAWDTLTRLEENLKAWESVESDLKKAMFVRERASLLGRAFLSARDSVLGSLYDGIRDRFVDLYRQLHGADETGFTAKIEPSEAALNLEVDFYGRGTNPPHALHSEGHQDSMGLCLYLALAERLTEGVIDLVILDDVVLSVDSGHRRQVCQLLKNCFSQKQFLITTHDKTWANQLRSEGIVDKRGSVEFYNWHVDTGPNVNYETDIWQRISEDLAKNDVPSASGKLRRGSEEFFGMVCDALHARTRHKLNSNYELGELLQAATGQYKALLKQAKKAAQSWGNTGDFDMLRELDSTVSQIYARSNAEQWAINASVHYNNWANLSVNDFRPVAEAFQDLHALFSCTTCGGLLHVTARGIEDESVRCNCGKVNWNLLEKSAAPQPSK